MYMENSIQWAGTRGMDQTYAENSIQSELRRHMDQMYVENSIQSELRRYMDQMYVENSIQSALLWDIDQMCVENSIQSALLRCMDSGARSVDTPACMTQQTGPYPKDRVRSSSKLAYRCSNKSMVPSTICARPNPRMPVAAILYLLPRKAALEAVTTVPSTAGINPSRIRNTPSR